MRPGTLLLLFVFGCVTNTLEQRDTAAPETTAGGSEPVDDGSTDTGDTDASDTGDTADSGAETAPEDYSVSGPYSVSVQSQTISASCDMETQIFTPDAPDALLVVLGHGFVRGPEQLVGWAEHLSSWGFTVAVPLLCHSSFLDTDHEANGEDMLAIPDALGASSVIYGGHSAGGLAAFVSAALDIRALGVIGLDATDADDIGLGYASILSVPALGMLGEPSSCNAHGNGAGLYQTAGDAVSVRVTDADHCDYESDTDWVCTSFCTNSSATFSDEEIQATIRGLMTAAAFEILAGGTEWWEEGQFYEELVSGGQIVPQ
ncbi:MAG: hypothetical protein P8R54_17995 [Myxococcota bacterium]|nr:hypothetical protein [Myxococcota bacterium]